MSEHESKALTAAEYDPQFILQVNGLKKHFPIKGGLLGRTTGYVKAVDGVTFNLRRGSTMGLVGESGCGKTTTGRSIIKLYDITSGSVYFKGIRIAAGVKSYKDAIAAAKKELAETKARLKGNTSSEAKAEIANASAKCAKTVSEMRAEIKKAKFDQKNCAYTFPAAEYAVFASLGENRIPAKSIIKNGFYVAFGKLRVGGDQRININHCPFISGISVSTG